MKAGDPEKPPDPAREAKLAARREKHAVKVWKANPKTQRLQSEKDAAVQELQILRDGTAGRQFAELRQRCERLEGERARSLPSLPRWTRPFREWLRRSSSSRTRGQRQRRE